MLMQILSITQQNSMGDLGVKQQGKVERKQERIN
jgi:hypothetical protein